MTTRADIVRTARSYLKTKFHHQGRQPGFILDCAGVLICAARENGIVPASFDVLGYSARPDGVSLLEHCDKYMTRISKSSLRPGDAVVVKIDTDPQHIGIVGNYRHGGLSIIHACSRAEQVIETRLMFTRAFEFVMGYRLPGLED